MSDLTECNYCRLQSLKHEAKKKGKKIMLMHNSEMGGYNLHLVFNDELPTEKNRFGWFMGITRSCVC